MKLIIAILILAAFLQTTILPINLVLLIIVLRSFLIGEVENLYLAFGFGLLISHLNATPLGIESLIYLILVILARSISRLPISSNILIVFPLILVSVIFDTLINSFLLRQSFQLTQIMWTTVLAIPIYLVLRFWEERFVVSPQLKLKI